jgi:hypothetical protein
MGMNDWGTYEKAAEKGPVSFVWKVVVLVVVLSAIIGGAGYVFGWFGEAAQVAHDEFGPKAALQKYEWFKEQAAGIKKMDQDVSMYEQRVKSVDAQYVAYGKDPAKWPLDVRVQYNHAKEQGRDDLVAIASQRNNLVKEYNAASSKFNWSPFQTNPDAPAKYFQEYVVK